MVMSDCQSTFDYLLPCGCLRLGPSTLQGKTWTCPIGTGSAREDRSRRHAFFCCWLLLGSRYTLSLKEPMPPVMRLGVEQRRSTLTNPEQAMKIGALLHARQRDKFALFAFSGACSDCPHQHCCTSGRHASWAGLLQASRGARSTPWVNPSSILSLGAHDVQGLLELIEKIWTQLWRKGWMSYDTVAPGGRTELSNL